MYNQYLTNESNLRFILSCSDKTTLAGSAFLLCVCEQWNDRTIKQRHRNINIFLNIDGIYSNTQMFIF